MKYYNHPKLTKITIISTKGQLSTLPFTVIKHNKFNKIKLALDLSNSPYWNKHLEKEPDTKIKQFQDKLFHKSK